MIVSTSPSAARFLEGLAVEGGTGEDSRLARTSTDPSKNSCSSSFITFLGPVSAGLAYTVLSTYLPMKLLLSLLAAVY